MAVSEAGRIKNTLGWGIIGRMCGKALERGTRIVLEGI